MILKNLFVGIWDHNKLLFIVVSLFILTSLFYNIQFARLANLVDHQKPVPHPVAFEAFPFVVYNMYSGKIDDWGKYSYLKIEVDGEEVSLTDLAVIQEDQFINPSQKFILLRSNSFREDGLLTYLKYSLDSLQFAENVYNRVSNQHFQHNEKYWEMWMHKYLEKTLKREIRTVKFFDCTFSYTASGKPEMIEQKLVYQF